MNSVRIDIINPKAKQLLQSLVDLKLISISEDKETKFMQAVKKIRGKSKASPISLEEISKEVESVRTKRYAKKRN